MLWQRLCLYRAGMALRPTRNTNWVSGFMVKPLNPAGGKHRAIVVRTLAGLLLVPACVGLLFVLFATLTGLSGDSPATALVLMASGNILFLFGLLLVALRPGTHLVVLSAAVLLPGVMFYAGYSMDKQFWSGHNDNLCKEFRSNSTCTEDDRGFSCGNWRDGMALSVPGAICLDKKLD